MHTAVISRAISNNIFQEEIWRGSVGSRNNSWLFLLDWKFCVLLLSDEWLIELGGESKDLSLVARAINCHHIVTNYRTQSEWDRFKIEEEGPRPHHKETGEVLGESKFYAAQSSTYSCIGFSSALDNLGMHNCYWQGRRRDSNNSHQILAGFRPNTSEHHLPLETLTPDSPSTLYYFVLSARHWSDQSFHDRFFIPMTHRKNHRHKQEIMHR